MPRRPTVYDVARRAGVSIATVSFSFRQPERVRVETRESVLRAARELGYVPSASARGLAEGTTGAFGMYAFDHMAADPSRVPDEELLTAPETMTDPRRFPLYVDEVERGFALECRASGRALLLSSGAPSGATVDDIAGRVDGLAIFPGPYPSDGLHHIAEVTPVVAFNSEVSSAPFSHVHVDNAAGIRMLVEHVVRVHGVTDLAFVGNLAVPEFRERCAAFHEVTAELVPDAPRNRQQYAGLATEHWPAALADLVAADRLPRALVCQNDLQAVEVLDALAAHAVPVPRRVIVTGFDGVLAGLLSQPTLTTVRQPLEAMGRLAVRLLNKRLADRTAPPERHVLPLRPVFRASCGCS